MSNIGFSDLEAVIYNYEYNQWVKSKSLFYNITYEIRKLRAIELVQGKDPNQLYPLEKYKQQWFLENLNKGIKS